MKKKKTDETPQESFQRQFEELGLAPERARKCAEIVARDSERQRTPKEQAYIQESHRSIFPQ